MGIKTCPPINEVLPIEAERQQVEHEIEQFIESHFQASPAALNALSVFSDPGNDDNGDNRSQAAFKSWLIKFSGEKMNNDRLSQSCAVPDIASRRNLLGEIGNEFYEIKPDTHNGRRKCDQKVRDVDQFLHELGVHFVRGIAYTNAPGQEFIFHTSIGAVEFEVTLKWRVDEPGKILYDVCVQAKQKQEVKDPVGSVAPFLLGLLILALAVAIAVILKGMGGFRPSGIVGPPTLA